MVNRYLEPDGLAIWLKQRIKHEKKAGDRSPRSRVVARLERLITRPLRIGVFGEPRTGKSSLINFLLGQKILPAARLGASQAVVHIRHGHEPAFFVVAPNKQHRTTRRAMLTKLAGAGHIAEGSKRAVIKAASRPSPSFAERSLTQERVDALQAATILEIRLPEPYLLNFELFEFPEAAAMAPEGSGVRKALCSLDFALCTTLAMQAWKRSEAVSWKQFGPFPRHRSMLVVTHGAEIDALEEERLLKRVSVETSEYFVDCSVASLSERIAPSSPMGGDRGRRDLVMLRQAIEKRLEELRMERRSKATAILSKLYKAHPDVLYAIAAGEAPSGRRTPRQESLPLLARQVD